MSKQIRHELTYDASLADVAAMLRDPAFRERVCEYQGVLRSPVTVEPDGAGMRVRIEQVQAAHGIPAFARSSSATRSRSCRTRPGRRAERGRHRDHASPASPGDMKGTATLAESGGTTTETVDLTVKVSIPLVGGKLEGLIADLLLKALKAENAVGREWLAGADAPPLAAAPEVRPTRRRPPRRRDGGAARSRAASTTNGAKAST